MLVISARFIFIGELIVAVYSKDLRLRSRFDRLCDYLLHSLIDNKVNFDFDFKHLCLLIFKCDDTFIMQCLSENLASFMKLLFITVCIIFRH